MELMKSAKIAQYAYKDSVSNTGYVSFGDGIEYSYEYFENNNTQLYIMEDTNSIIVAIRGSSEKEDFIDDLNVKNYKDKDIGRVHRGFHECASEIHDMVFDAIYGSNKKVYFIGHSLGGAIAKILSLKITSIDVEVITFGEPKSIKKKSITSHTYRRVVNNCDIVPRIPFWYSFGVDREILYYIDRNDEILVNPSRWKMAKDIILTKFSVFIGKQKPFDLVNDHFIKSYIRMMSEHK